AQQLHGEKGLAVGRGAEVVHGDDPGVVERRDVAELAAEGDAGGGAVQHLEGHVLAARAIEDAHDLGHAALAERRAGLVAGPEAPVPERGVGDGALGVAPPRRCCQGFWMPARAALAWVAPPRLALDTAPCPTAVPRLVSPRVRGAGGSCDGEAWA